MPEEKVQPPPAEIQSGIEQLRVAWAGARQWLSDSRRTVIWHLHHIRRRTAVSVVVENLLVAGALWSTLMAYGWLSQAFLYGLRDASWLILTFALFCMTVKVFAKPPPPPWQLFTGFWSAAAFGGCLWLTVWVGYWYGQDSAGYHQPSANVMAIAAYAVAPLAVLFQARIIAGGLRRLWHSAEIQVVSVIPAGAPRNDSDST